ncbi:MAG: electron transfer flavoprotein subunit alpha/FixB family protein [Proteobacteria bacterium]|nr:electron transfer flavoprotein subunit alpha/FixB family protein [Pseudomonadota bacterium]
MNKDIWIIAEHFENRVRPVTSDLVAFARKMGGEVKAVILGHPVKPLAEDVAQKTGCEVTGIDSPGAAVYNSEVYRNLIKKLCERNQPRYLLVPHTPLGWDFAPALAVDLGYSSISAVTDFNPENSTFIRQILNGKLLEELKSPPGCSAVVTVMPGSANPEPDNTRPPGSVKILEFESPPVKTRTIRYLPAKPGTVNLKDAEVIVAAGRGLKVPERIELIRELASLFKRGAVGASRPLCDQGWLPLEHQVGMTGATVSPKLYLACGISGALQHTMGMKNSSLIVAVNTDRKAPILQVAHFCVNTDLSKFIPVLIKNIRKFRG